MHFINFYFEKILQLNERKYDLTEHDKDPCIVEFVKMVYLIEERLPYLSFIKILNKQSVVTQNVQPNPELLQMLSLNFISAPTQISSPELPDHLYLDSLSHNLWNLVTSFTVRQKQFKDYLNIALPIVSYSKILPFGMLSKFIFIIEFALDRKLIFDMLDSFGDKKSESNSRIDVYSVAVEANNLDSLYNSIKLEWISMCKMYNLILELRQALQKYPEMGQQIKIKKANFKRLIVRYGPEFAYTIQFKWSKEGKFYDIVLGVDAVKGAVAKVDEPLINYHVLFLNEIKRYFASTNYSIVNLVQVLNYTCVSTFGLAKLTSFPKFYSRVSNQPVAAMPGFMLIICSMTHLRLTYYSRYCLDIHIKPNGLVSIRDGSFGLTDISTAIEDLHPIQFLNVSLIKIINKIYCHF
jgi:hypothetical protein